MVQLFSAVGILALWFRDMRWYYREHKLWRMRQQDRGRSAENVSGGAAQYENLSGLEAEQEAVAAR